MKSKGEDRGGHIGVRNSISQFILNNSIILVIISLAWLLFRSGRKPTRIHYPCQKAAAANVSLFFTPLLFPLLKKANDVYTISGLQKTLRILLLVAVCGGSFAATMQYWNYYQENRYAERLKAMGPIGQSIGGAMAAAGSFLSTPYAMAAISPHRVVSVHHSDATSWNFSCTGSGACPVYYGDNAFVNQSVVDLMFDSGLKGLTGTTTIESAWKALLPNYRPNEIVAIKVNFNDSIMGGGTRGYGDNDAYVDALPQVVNAVISGLKMRGVAEQNIRVFDSSRYITDRFRALIKYKNIRYFDREGNGEDVDESTFTSSLSSSRIHFAHSNYSGSTHKVSDVLVESDYLINIPIMKSHGGAGITLSLKNHLGSINGFTSGGHSMHSYFYPAGGNYDSESNPVTDINLNGNIKDKTILIIGDGLYGGLKSNNTPPEVWSSFDNDSPNMLFFGIDPVATDSVMFDFIDRERDVDPASQDILIVSARNGLGVHERWNNDDDRKYSIIDYVEIDHDDDKVRPILSNIPLLLLQD
jgi:hypothetical protein